MRKLLLLSIVLFSAISLTADDCVLNERKINNLVKENWSSIQEEASCIVSDRRNFEVEDYWKDGPFLSVEVFSKGFLYNISFVVQFEDIKFKDDCTIGGKVKKVYDCKKEE